MGSINRFRGGMDLRRRVQALQRERKCIAVAEIDKGEFHPGDGPICGEIAAELTYLLAG
jgi:hypothetical protein